MSKLVVFGVMVTCVVLLPCTMAIAQDGENVLLQESFDDGEKRTHGK